ncbi:MAG: hypothetical protein GTO45_09395 [Candidatus Aminicenantes bacterium]|nr:hypothetical protein [Candidatus Aminicenantes bacterium]NIM79028.1 hypothetical protein [Candidatus Aminicenantes bacterium]NIN18307.1 hypothetical protein [Candidatus Aminicenantes bacterium]NIN42194.1 hypothetical protein [Candidatus Aminicenantes bacterium]NIN84960.1 hypothetical protein [Candidatus Aminicenantes bacterium]
MQVICVAEVTPDYDIRVDENIKKKLHPGEKIRIKIESIGEVKEQKRLSAIERLKKMSMNSRLGLYNEIVKREDAHDREKPPNI